MGGVNAPDQDQPARTPPTGRRLGRRPGGADTRGVVLEAARAEFAARGYEKASIRGIARAAGVDSALVHHYFGTKDQLFRAALDFPLDPRFILDQILTGDREHVGERIARFALTLWQDPEIRDRLMATVRGAATNDQVAELLRGFMTRELISVAAERLEVPDPMLRAELVMSQLVGLAMARHVIGVQPLASTGIEELVALVGPTLQRYLTSPA